MSEWIDTDYTRYVTCPYCGYEDDDSWEINFDGENDLTIQCDKCEKDFIVHQDIDITYCSRKKEEP